MPTIELTQGKRARVDWCDYKRVAQYKWHADPNGYAIRTDYSGGQKRTIRMHRFILGLAPGRDVLVDHKNHDPSDNRRRNIRAVTSRENSENRVTQSKWGIGVRRIDRLHSRPYRACVQVDDRNVHVGYFATPEEARNAREAFVKDLEHGASARHPESLSQDALGGEEARP